MTGRAALNIPSSTVAERNTTHGGVFWGGDMQCSCWASLSNKDSVGGIFSYSLPASPVMHAKVSFLVSFWDERARMKISGIINSWRSLGCLHGSSMSHWAEKHTHSYMNTQTDWQDWRKNLSGCLANTLFLPSPHTRDARHEIEGTGCFKIISNEIETRHVVVTDGIFRQEMCNACCTCWFVRYVLVEKKHLTKWGDTKSPRVEEKLGLNVRRHSMRLLFRRLKLYVRMRVTVTSELVIYEDKRFQRNLVTCARLLYQYPLDSLLQISVHLFSIDQHIMRFTMVTICNIVKSQDLHNFIIKWINKIIWKSTFFCIIKRHYVL